MPRVTAIQIRPARPGDGPGFARAWLDAGRYYAHLDPASFQIPARDGLAEWFDQTLTSQDPHTLCLAATVSDDIAGFLSATLQPPHPAARWQLLSSLSQPLLFIQALVVAEQHRRHGVGTALMTAAEEWARDNGAMIISLDTYLHSPLSVPFYEQRMGYRRRSIVFRKDLT
jgi:GNAT superfamily N-acetyltransferase